MSNLQNTHGTFGTEASSGLTGSHQKTGLEQAVPGISNTPDVPPSIPLPNQTSMNTNANLPESQANVSQVRLHLITLHKKNGKSRSIACKTNGLFTLHKRMEGLDQLLVKLMAYSHCTGPEQAQGRGPGATNMLYRNI